MLLFGSQFTRQTQVDKKVVQSFRVMGVIEGKVNSAILLDAQNPT